MKAMQTFIPTETWSCDLCQGIHEKSFSIFILGKQKRFCCYKHAWHFLWRKIFGWFVDGPRTFVYVDKKLLEVGGFKTIAHNGWSDEKIIAAAITIAPKIFEKIKYDRQKWSFQLTKILMEEFKYGR